MDARKRIFSKGFREARPVKTTHFLLACGLALSSIVPIFFLIDEGVSRKLDPLILPEQYFLQSGDKVVVALSGAINFAYETIVTPEGKIFLQTPGEQRLDGEMLLEVIDEVVVSGLNLTQAGELLTRSFSKYFKNVEVRVSLIELRTFSVFVAGAIVNPGVYEASPILRVSQVLDTAQLKGNASQSRIQLIRDGETVMVDICEFHITGDPEGNPYLRDRDIIFVPEMKASVIVKGAVYGRGAHRLRMGEMTDEQSRTSEGTYELLRGERVSDILKKAGGTAPWADLRNAYLERLLAEQSGTARVDLDVKKIVSGNDPEADVLMQDGDVLVIPSVEEKIYVIGAVTEPGALGYQSTLSVTDYIGLAGGPTERANLKGIQILRADGTRVRVRFGLESPELRQGDTIVVPEVTLKWWQDYVTIITAVSSVIISWLVIAK
jgi:protein involved in polysaccharide export with SLBB domain